MVNSDGQDNGSLRLKRTRRNYRGGKQVYSECTIFPVYFHGGNNCLYIGSRYGNLGPEDIKSGDKDVPSLNIYIKDGEVFASANSTGSHGGGKKGRKVPAKAPGDKVPQRRSRGSGPSIPCTRVTRSARKQAKPPHPVTPIRAGNALLAPATTTPRELSTPRLLFGDPSTGKRRFRSISEAEELANKRYPHTPRNASQLDEAYNNIPEI